MKHTIQASLPPMELTAVDSATVRRSTDVAQTGSARDTRVAPLTECGDTTVDRARELLQRAVSDCCYTLDALAAATGKDRTYIHKVLQGDKPLAYAFVVSLPLDLQKRFETLRAKSLGLIVVEPVSEEQAICDLVSGLVGLLAPGRKQAAA